jgi:glycosyltransferase involved in cell wall biosynthesis
MSRRSPRIVLIHRSGHHAGPSGHARLPEHLPGVRAVHGARSVVPYRARKAVVPVRGAGPLYDSSSLAKELTAVTAAVVRPHRRGIVHYLDAERDVGPGVSMLAPTRWRTVGTFHLPARAIEALPPRAAFGHLDAAIALATTQVEAIEAVAPTADVRHIPYGVDTAWFTPSEREPGPPRLLFVGHHLRDFAVLREALDALHQRMGAVTVTAVTLPGARELLPERPWLQVRTGITDEELRAAYRSASLLLLPLTDAAACTSMLEALACGLPVVATEVGGVADYLDEACGALVEPGSAEALVEAASALLASEDLEGPLRSAARARALRFSWPDVARRVAALYDVLLGRSS